MCFLSSECRNASVHNSFISNCPLVFDSFPLHASSPLLSAHHHHLHLTPYLPLSICPFVWNKAWIHYSFVQTYLSSPCPLSAKLFFLIVLRLFTTRTASDWKHHNTGECFFFSGTDKNGSRGSKNPFRGFSCHNNSSASLKITVVCVEGLYKAIKQGSLRLHST